nr:MAG TPA: hypothetical protein [Caudoviricetes sp.]
MGSFLKKEAANNYQSEIQKTHLHRLALHHQKTPERCQ